MKKNTLILVGILLVLVAGYFVFVHQWNGPDNVFHIEDSTKVGRIELERFDLGKSKAKIDLEKGIEGEWTVNGQYTANQAKVEDFLLTLKAIRVLKPIEQKGQASSLSILKRNHTRVKIYDRDGDEIRDYLIGATNSEQTANIFKMGFSDRTYLVSKPALEGYVSIFYTTELNIWRENLLFNVKGEDLTAFSINYADSIHNFALRHSPQGWLVGEGALADQNRVKNYLELFTGKIFAESFADKGNPGMLDSLKRRVPSVEMKLVTEKENLDVLLFSRPENPNNFFGYVEGREELLTVQQFVIGQFLKTRDYFLQNPL